ncbi:DUF4012 domain-containing protein [Nocardioides humilatus]|uniref:DUF4012 domain-containing protein n=1 Tax=Nocardioides humilatus TaxID=2607660 RepID=A0A5B1LPG6_9ACTN|nr:DUF4012 domain-containing protein [Nocardioides humilatus]KAA1421457.1 DUF4012 domain-containing protein [Nocardioides humilatus]
MSPVVRRRRRRRPRGWRGVVWWLRDQPRRTAWLAAGVVVGVFLLWTGWTVFSAVQALKDVQHDALVLRSELQQGDAEHAREALQDYQDSAARAQGRTDGPTWWMIEQTPLVGDDAEAVATAAEVLADLGDDGIPQLVDAAQLVAARSFNPADHRFPLETIESIGRPAKESERAFEAAATRLQSVDSSGLSGPLGSRYDELSALVLDARSALGSAYRAAELMPSLLGADGPRNHLLVFENNAELRSLGGLAGSISLVHADGGDVDIVKQEGTSKYGGLQRPIIKLTAGEERVFGPTLGQWFMNASMTPDAPRAADLAAARWKREIGGDVDGVFFVDPVAVSYLLRATGPVEVPGYGAVSSADVVSKVENQIYLNAPDRAAQEDFQNAVASAVFDAFAAGRGDPVSVIRELVTAVSEGRIRVHSFVDDEQALIADTAIAGQLTTEDDRPHVGVYVNDALESKMTYYLHYEVQAVARKCSGAGQEVAGTIALTNTAPADYDLPPSVTGLFPFARFYGEIEPGQQRVAVYVMAPRGGRLTELSLDGRSFDPVASLDLDGREVAQVIIVMDPGQTQKIDFTATSGPGQTGPVRLDVTPGAFPGSSARTLPSAC